MLDAIVSFQFMYHHVILKIHSFIFSWFFDLFNFTSHLVQFQYLISSFCHHFSFPFLGRHIFVLFSASTHFGHRTGYFFCSLSRGLFCPNSNCAHFGILQNFSEFSHCCVEKLAFPGWVSWVTWVTWASWLLLGSSWDTFMLEILLRQKTKTAKNRRTSFLKDQTLTRWQFDTFDIFADFYSSSGYLSYPVKQKMIYLKRKTHSYWSLPRLP